VARWLAVRATRWSIRDVNAADTELLWLMFPRALITAVLALQVLAAKELTFFFMLAMAFTVVLSTNIFVVVAAVRSKSIPVETVAPTGVAPQAPVAPSLPASPVSEPETQTLSRENFVLLRLARPSGFPTDRAGEALQEAGLCRPPQAGK
jgi:hypothetical protein